MAELVRVKLKVEKIFYGVQKNIGDEVPVRPDVARRWEKAGECEIIGDATIAVPAVFPDEDNLNERIEGSED